MANTERTILGVFDEPAMADQAIDALQTAGFHGDQIHYPGQHTSGGFLAGLKNFFGGDEATAGNITDDLTGMGVSADEARYYENEHRAGHAVVAVQARGREQEALDILRSNGANIHSAKRDTTTSTTSSTLSTPASTLQTKNVDNSIHTNRTDKTLANDVAETNDERVLRLREEQLNVNKQRVQAGEVDLHKEIVTEQKTINVPVTHEEAFIERHPVTNAIANDTTPIGEGESIRIPLTEEKVNVNKETVVTGEVSIGKRAVEETKRVTDSVKREKLRVEQEGDAPIHGTKSDRFHPDSVDKDTL